MNRMYATLMLVVLMALMLTGCGAQKRSSAPAASPQPDSLAPVAPSQQPSPPAKADEPAKPPTAGWQLPGKMDLLQRALAEPAALTYQIEVIREGGIADKTAYLDQFLGTKNWPEPNMLVLLVFADNGHDIRFAMGANMSAAKVSVDEMLSLVRSLYLPAARQGDPADGLAQLIQAVNKRMSH